MWNYKAFLKLNLSFLPDLPTFDVSEKAIYTAKKNNYKIVALKNSFNDRSVLDVIEKKYNDIIGVDISINDNNEVMFLHLGRGILKSVNKYRLKENFVSIKKWLDWNEKYNI